jgi:hypothetical protein
LIKYLLGKLDHLKRPRAGVRVLRGDPQRMAKLIDSLKFVNRYLSGSVNFHVDDDPSEAEMQGYLDDLFEAACPGMDPEQVEWCAVLHEEDDGSRHIHVAFAKVDLTSGLAFNPAPPGWEKWVGPLRDMWNHSKGWARPDAPERAQLVQPAGKLASSLAWRKGEDPRQIVTNWLVPQIDQGLVPDRAAVLKALATVGQINKVRDDYISFTPANSIDGKPARPIRLKGVLYSSDYSRERAQEVVRAQIRLRRKPGRAEPDLRAAAKARVRLAAITEGRRQFNLKTYGPDARSKRKKGVPADLAAPLINSQPEHLIDELENGFDRVGSTADHIADREERRERACAEIVGGAARASSVAVELLRKTNVRFERVRGELDEAARGVLSGDQLDEEFMNQAQRLSLKDAINLGWKEQSAAPEPSAKPSLAEALGVRRPPVAANDAALPVGDPKKLDTAVDDDKLAKLRRLVAEQESAAAKAAGISQMMVEAPVANTHGGGFIGALIGLFDRFIRMLQRLLGISTVVQQAKAENGGEMTAEAKAKIQGEVRNVEAELRQSKEEAAGLRSVLDKQMAKLSARVAARAPATAKLDELGQVEGRVDAELAKIKAELGDVVVDAPVDPIVRIEQLLERRAVLEVELAQLLEERALGDGAIGPFTRAKAEAQMDRLNLTDKASRLAYLNNLATDRWRDSQRISAEIAERQAELGAIDEELAKLGVVHAGDQDPAIDDQDQDEDDRGRGPQG